MGVSVTTEKKVPVWKDNELTLTYEVLWRESNVEFNKRYDKYLDASFFKHKVGWQDVVNVLITL